MTATVRSTLIIEDNYQARHWLDDCCHRAFPDTTTVLAQNVAEARRVLAPPLLRRLDLALIDIGLPDGSGISLIDEIRSRFPDCMCVVTTIYDDEENLFNAISAGADGYLLKFHETDKLVELLKRISDDEPPLSPAIARRILASMKPPTVAEIPTEDIVALTPREEETLSMLGRGFQLRQIADAMEISQNTVASHVKSIYRKLNISNRAEAALIAADRGLIDR